MARPRILVAVDFSDLGRTVLEAGTRLALDMDADLVLVHAFGPGVHVSSYIAARSEHATGQAERQVREEEAVTLTTEWANEARRAGIDVTPVLGEDAPEKVILDAAEEHGVALIVLGSHGHGRLWHMFLGDTAEGLLGEVRCPVVIVPQGLAG